METSPTPGDRTMSLTSVPVALPSTKQRLGAVPPASFTIDCADCMHQHTSVCDDCVVSFIVDRQPDDAVVVDVEEARAVRLLAQAGLVPGVRHSRDVG
jgi:hypothetical protein